MPSSQFKIFSLVIFNLLFSSHAVHAEMQLSCRGMQGKSYQIDLSEKNIIEKMGSLELKKLESLRVLEARPQSALIKQITTLIDRQGKTAAVMSFFNDGSVRGSIAKDRVTCIAFITQEELDLSLQ